MGALKDCGPDNQAILSGRVTLWLLWRRSEQSLGSQFVFVVGFPMQ